MEDTANKDIDAITKALLTPRKIRRGKKVRTILDPLLSELGLPKVSPDELHRIAGRQANKK